jgi:ribosomal protein L44E
MTTKKRAKSCQVQRLVRRCPFCKSTHMLRLSSLKWPGKIHRYCDSCGRYSDANPPNVKADRLAGKEKSGSDTEKL